MSRSILYVLIAALAAGLGLWLGQRHFQSPAQAVAVPVPAPALKTVRLIDPPLPLQDFRLQSADGSELTASGLRGHWTLVFLGFTHCPDVCPTTLADLARAQALWEPMPEAIRPRVLFVSVDPDRDTPKATGDYAAYFHPATLAATANEPALGDFAKALGLVYMKVPTTGEDYTMDHSATLVVLDPQGRRAGLIRPPLDAAAIASDMRALAESRP